MGDKKEKVRRYEEELLASGKITPIELGMKNFCMKGVDLASKRNPDGSFSLF